MANAFPSDTPSEQQAGERMGRPLCAFLLVLGLVTVLPAAAASTTVDEVMDREPPEGPELPRLPMPERPDFLEPPPLPERIEIHSERVAADKSVPAMETPRLDRRDVASTPGVEAPATCHEVFCGNATTLPTASTPFVAPVPVKHDGIHSQRLALEETTIPTTCVPVLLCAPDPAFIIPGQELGETPETDPVDASTPAIEPQPIDLPVNELPAVCTLAPQACLGPIMLLPAMPIQTPGQDAIPLTPDVALDVENEEDRLLVEPHAREPRAVGPAHLEIPTPFGNFGLTFCPEETSPRCTVPLAPKGEIHGRIVLGLGIGDRRVGHTVGIDQELA